MATYEDIQRANSHIKTTPIKGKDYAEVNQRIKAFRMVYPEGSIETEMLSNENGICIFRAEVSVWDGDGLNILGTGTAYESEGSSFINETSYIENCETSAVGRALGMAGFGIDTSIASYEEVTNAINNQGSAGCSGKKASPKQLSVLKTIYKGELLDKLLVVNNIARIEDLSLEKASELISKNKEKNSGK